MVNRDLKLGPPGQLRQIRPTLKALPRSASVEGGPPAVTGGPATVSGEHLGVLAH